MRFALQRTGSLVLLVLTFALPACDRPGESSPEASLGTSARTAERRGTGSLLAAGESAPPAVAAPPAVQKIVPAAAPAPAVDALPIRQRHVAVRHDLAVIIAADAVEAAWKAAETACLAADCELLASHIARDNERAPAIAYLDARLPPAALTPFLERLGGLGTIGRHGTAAEDKTAEVVDVEARLKNMAEFRDSLRKLMATPNARLKDLVEVERELTRVQSELDTLATRRKLLGNDTEKVRVTVAFSARPAVLEAGMWLPVKNAVLHAGHVLAHTVATLIGLAIALLPWALVLLAGGLGLRALLRRRRARLAA